MTEIWTESAKFSTRNQRLADSARMIVKKGWFSYFEIVDIRGRESRKGYAQENPTK